MGTWLNIGGWVCVAITIVGLVLSVIVWRKKGPGSGLRGIAWSLIPLGAYLTHSIRLIGQIVSAVVQFATSFVFSHEGLARCRPARYLRAAVPGLRWHSADARSQEAQGGQGWQGDALRQ